MAANFFKNIQGVLFYGRVGDWLEKIAKKMQLKKMAKNTESLAKENDSRVIISDTMLKFHEKTEGKNIEKFF